MKKAPPTKLSDEAKAAKEARRKARREERRRAIEDKPSKPPVASRGKGMLRINTRPWSQVFVDGRLIGNTPQMSLLLSVGKHKVRLANPQFGLEKTITVKITRGGKLTRIIDLTK